MKAYGCEEPKGIFPYEWFDSMDKLDFPSLPPMSAFYSKLKRSNPLNSIKDYQALKKIWQEREMETFRDYLVYYNNQDTGPFCEALQTFMTVYRDEGIDIFKDFITLPGVARRMLHRSSQNKFSLFSRHNSDLYYTFKTNKIFSIGKSF